MNELQPEVQLYFMPFIMANTSDGRQTLSACNDSERVDCRFDGFFGTWGTTLSTIEKYVEITAEVQAEVAADDEEINRVVSKLKSGYSHHISQSELEMIKNLPNKLKLVFVNKIMEIMGKQSFVSQSDWDHNLLAVSSQLAVGLAYAGSVCIPFVVEYGKADASNFDRTNWAASVLGGVAFRNPLSSIPSNLAIQAVEFLGGIISDGEPLDEVTWQNVERLGRYGVNAQAYAKMISEKACQIDVFGHRRVRDIYDAALLKIGA